MKSFLVFNGIWLLTVILVAVSSPGLFYIVSETLFFIGRSNPDTLALSTQLLHFPAEHDFLPAQTELGTRYTYGQGVEKNTALGIKWLNQAAAGNDKRAREMLSTLFMFESSEAERRDLLQSLKTAAKQNSLASQSTLSLAYYYGLGTKQDLSQAFSWCKEAANRNRAQAQLQLARYYQFGLGTDKDETAMFAWEEKAAKQGMTSSQIQLAIDYLDGKGAKPNTQEGLKWLEKAAKHGNYRAQTLLGLIYKFHLFEKNDNSVAMKYLSEPVKQKSSIAAYLISVTPSKSVDALKQFQSSAARGDQHAAAVLGEMYATGCGAPLSMPDAIKWYTTAASKGDSDSQIRLGILYTYGAVDGKPDFAKAKSLFEQAADAGNVEGMYIRGRNELTGMGCQLNREKAKALISKAAALGNIEAAILHATISQTNKADKKQALEWLRVAGDKGDAVAQEMLCDVDHFDYEKWNKLAAEQGFGPALRETAEHRIVGIRDTKDTPGGIKILEELSQSGDSEARISLAEDYRFGLFDTPEDKNKAAKLLEEEAMRGSATAQLKLAEMYRMSELGEEKKGEACKWYEKAASQGSQEGVRKRNQYCDKGKLKWGSDE